MTCRCGLPSQQIWPSGHFGSIEPTPLQAPGHFININNNININISNDININIYTPLQAPGNIINIIIT